MRVRSDKWIAGGQEQGICSHLPCFGGVPKHPETGRFFDMELQVEVGVLAQWGKDVSPGNHTHGRKAVWRCKATDSSWS